MGHRPAWISLSERFVCSFGLPLWRMEGPGSGMGVSGIGVSGLKSAVSASLSKPRLGNFVSWG